MIGIATLTADMAASAAQGADMVGPVTGGGALLIVLGLVVWLVKVFIPQQQAAAREDMNRLLDSAREERRTDQQHFFAQLEAERLAREKMGDRLDENTAVVQKLAARLEAAA